MNIQSYLKAQAACLYDYRFLPRAREIASGKPAMNSGKQGQDILQHALRQLAGEDTQGRICADGALSVLAPLIQLGGKYSTSGLPPDTQVHVIMKANCIAACAYLNKFKATPEQVSAAELDAQRLTFPDGALRAPDAVNCILHAIDYANQAACMQFIGRIVLLVGATFRDLTERIGLDVWSFKQYAPLWHAVERCEYELSGKKYLEEWRKKPVVLFPVAKVCASPGCFGCLEGKDQWEPCCGNCAWERKPWYCSSMCRAEAWENHRPSCKPPRARWPVKLPSSITLDWKMRDLFIRKLVPNGPVEQLEVVPKDVVNTLDTRNGIIVRASDMPSLCVPGETVKCVLKRYT